jgi:probable FeS assembly SUF system protein SufT
MSSYEEVTFSRDCPVILIPDGDTVVLEAGTRGWITQVLGGNFTLQMMTGRLVRVNAEDGGAIGKEAAVRAEVDSDPNAPVHEEQVWEALKTCYDPEIPLNIVELGLVYSCLLRDLEGGGTGVDVLMTLTAPGCGMGQVLADDVKRKVSGIPGVGESQVELTFDPPWSPNRMSEAARLELGMF